MPRNIGRRKTRSLFPPCTPQWKPGVKSTRSDILSTPLVSISSAVSTVIVSGISSNLSSRLRAVTTISSSASPASSIASSSCALAVGITPGAANIPSAIIENGNLILIFLRIFIELTPRRLNDQAYALAPAMHRNAGLVSVRLWASVPLDAPYFFSHGIVYPLARKSQLSNLVQLSDIVFQEIFAKKDKDSDSAHVSRREAIGLRRQALDEDLVN